MARLPFAFRIVATADTVRAQNRLIGGIIAAAQPKFRTTAPVSDAVRQGILDNFINQSGNGIPWRPLAAITRKERRRLGYHPTRPILVRSGSYRDSFVQPGGPRHYESLQTLPRGWRYEVGSNDPRVPILEGGEGRPPARPATLLTPRAESRIGDALDMIYNRLFARAEGNSA